MKGCAMANVALGKPVEENHTGRELITDGKRTGYSGKQGFCHFYWPGRITVDLRATFSVKCIRVLLWDGDSRLYKYRLLISTDHRAWQVVHEAETTGSNGWQVFRFPAGIPVRYVRVHGLHNTSNSKIHIVEIEVHDSEPDKLEKAPKLDRTLDASECELESGDKLPIGANFKLLISELERIQAETQVLNKDLIKKTVDELKVQLADITAIERDLDSIRRRITMPVEDELARLRGESGGCPKPR
jgi:hypothetical protein